jgi:hypothetical protein
MAYVILRTEKYKTRNTIAGLVGHHLRIPGSKLDNVDLSRSPLNVVIGAHDRDSFNKAVRGRIATCTRKPRPDANKVVEMMLGASPEFFEGKSYEEQKAYLYDCLDFAKGFFGEANILGAYMHFDEGTPHISILATPIETSVRKTKKTEREVTTLNASHFFGGKDAMIQMQTDVALFVQARGHDLLRGEPKSESNREHEPLGSYWKQQAKTIDAAAAAAADILNDAAIESQTAADLFDHAAQEANRTGVEATTLTAQRDALDAGDKALRKRELDCAARESVISLKETHAAETMRRANQARSAADKLWDRATKEMKEAERLGALYIDAQKQLLEVHDIARIAARPELEGMVKLLAESEDARDLLFLMQHDPEMVSYIRTSMLMTAASRAEAQTSYSDVDWAVLLQASEEAKPKDAEFDWSSGGPAGP